jgi:hypothetical protein
VFGHHSLSSTRFNGAVMTQFDAIHGVCLLLALHVFICTTDDAGMQGKLVFHVIVSSVVRLSVMMIFSCAEDGCGKVG